MGNPKTGKNRITQRNIYLATGLSNNSTTYSTDDQDNDWGKFLVGYSVSHYTQDADAHFVTIVQFKGSDGSYHVADGLGIDVYGLTITGPLHTTTGFYFYSDHTGGGFNPIPIVSDWKMSFIFDTQPGNNAALRVEALLLDEFGAP